MLVSALVLVIEKGNTMTNNPLEDLLKDAGLEVSKVKTLPSTIPSQDIVDELQIEQGLNLQSDKSSKKDDGFTRRNTQCNVSFGNRTVTVNFTYKKVKGIDVGDTAIGSDGKSNADKNRYAVYVDKKFPTGVYFTTLQAVKQFEFMLKYNKELFTSEHYSEYHISENWKLPTQFQTDIGRNKCMTWTSNSGVPVLVPTITQCQNYDNSNDLKGTPFDRPLKVMSKANLRNVRIDFVSGTDIPVITPERWSAIAEQLHAGNSIKNIVTHDEASFLVWYQEQVSKVKP